MPNREANPHQATRGHHANETAEDYVEAIFDILSEQQACRVQDLANHFGVSHVTVSRIVGRLQKQELLTTAPYKPIQLTEQGRLLAKTVKKRHEIVFDFLRWLGVDERTAEIDSEGIEHHVSKKTLAAMKRKLKG